MELLNLICSVLGGNRGYPEENHPGRGRFTIHLRPSFPLNSTEKLALALALVDSLTQAHLISSQSSVKNLYLLRRVLCSAARTPIFVSSSTSLLRWSFW